MNAQLPNVPQDVQLTGTEAINYMNRVALLIPQLKPTFGALTKGANCALAYGVVGAKVYVTPEYTAAAGIVVVSKKQAEQLPQIALRCFIDDAVTGGGPTSGNFSPCMRRYYYDRVTFGVQDRYFVLIGGTNTASCDLIQSAHRNMNPISW